MALQARCLLSQQGQWSQQTQHFPALNEFQHNTLIGGFLYQLVPVPSNGPSGAERLDPVLEGPFCGTNARQPPVPLTAAQTLWIMQHMVPICIAACDNIRLPVDLLPTFYETTSGSNPPLLPDLRET